MAVLEVSAGNNLILTATVSTNIKILNVVSAFVLSQGNAETPAARDVQSTISLSHRARTSYGKFSASVAHSISFNQFTHPKSASLFASNFLALNHVGAHPFFEDPVSVLLLTQIVMGERALHLPTTLTLTQVVEARHLRSESLEQTLELESVVGYYLNKRSFYALNRPLPTPPDKVDIS